MAYNETNMNKDMLKNIYNNPHNYVMCGIELENFPLYLDENILSSDDIWWEVRINSIFDYVYYEYRNNIHCFRTKHQYILFKEKLESVFNNKLKSL